MRALGLSLRGRYDWTPGVVLGLALLAFFFGMFLLYPVLYVLRGAFYYEGELTGQFFGSLWRTPLYREGFINSVNIAAVTTLITLLIAVPLAFAMVRVRFPGRWLLEGLLLVPMILPPFVGAVGMRQFFARFGTVNLVLMDLGLLREPIDWLGAGGFWGVVVLEVLHLYPIMYLNVAAALANVDPSLEEAAESLGSHGWRLFRTVTLPLIRPGLFAGASIVFIWAFTDLGPPLVFEYRQVLPVQIFSLVTDIHTNPVGYALVVWVLLITVLFFAVSKRWLASGHYEMMGRGAAAPREREWRGGRGFLLFLACLALVLLALLPHCSVVLTSVAGRWFLSPLPSAFTDRYYRQILAHDLTLPSIRNSLLYSLGSTVVDLGLGVLLAFLLTRRRVWAAGLWDALAMLPLALPGLVMAFGYVGTFSSGPFENTFLDPFHNPTALLIVAYAVRRLPYSLRAVIAGFQQTSVALEEASLNLGATPWQTVRRITLPLIGANLLAGGLLAFSFAMLEVSDSLILALQERHYPITKAIYALLARPGDGPYIASAMGVLGMVLLALSLMAASRLLGRKMGELFKAG